MYRLLKKCRSHLTQQQYKTIKGQITAGDFTGAEKGITRLMRKNANKVSNNKK